VRDVGEQVNREPVAVEPAVEEVAVRPPPPVPAPAPEVIQVVPSMVHVTQYGDRFHISRTCRGLRHARQVYDRDACAVCAGGRGA
jgi:hypothetical protein